jgi:hypothetical protein
MLRPDLPAEVHSKAYPSPGGGEYAWRRSDIAEAADALVDNGCAILGGEVQLVPKLDGNWSGLIPSADGTPDGVWSWDTDPQDAEESSESYCRRVAAESINVVARMTVEAQCSSVAQEHLWFNLTWTSRQEV